MRGELPYVASRWSVTWDLATELLSAVDLGSDVLGRGRVTSLALHQVLQKPDRAERELLGDLLVAVGLTTRS